MIYILKYYDQNYIHNITGIIFMAIKISVNNNYVFLSINCIFENVFMHFIILYF